NTTYDMLMSVNLPPSVGTSSMNVNFGQLNNKGLDLSLSAQIIRNKDWFWSVTLTGGHVMDQIRKISEGLKNDIDNPYDSSKPKILFVEGGSQYDIYAMRSAGIDPATGKEIFIKKNGEYTFNYDEKERVAVGNTNPILQGSLMNTLRYKGFSISVATSYTFGSDYFNSTLKNKVENIDLNYNVDRRVFTDRWKEPGDHTRFLGIGTSSSSSQYSERFVEKRNELYISSIQVMYDFAPKAITRLGLRKLAIGFGLSDIAHISTVKFERGTDYPYCRGINLIFRPTF
ncbi:MAG: SusC/RagA family TonB-linked outer membrane protein, partial [Bacteroidales bacterium]|nr:SusC/RagA family TonB-linked outer membrane protein [Bacteroidales bacterium]